MLTALGVALCGMVVGLLVGITGIGGILIPPFMIVLLGLDTHLAMGTSMASFLPSCMFALWEHCRRGSIDWSAAVPMAAAGFVCVFIGTELKALSPGEILNILLAVLVILVGGMTFRPLAVRTAEKGRTAWLSAAGLRLALLGGAVGVVSGLTGAGGPVLTIPVMITMGYSPLAAIASGMLYAAAVSVAGTVGNALHGAVDFPLAGLCALGQIVGVWLAFIVVRFLSAAMLKNLVGCVCVATGLGILLKTLWPWL